MKQNLSNDVESTIPDGTNKMEDIRSLWNQRVTELSVGWYCVSHKILPYMLYGYKIGLKLWGLMVDRLRVAMEAKRVL